METIGFEWTTTIFAGLLFIVALLLLIYWLAEGRRKNVDEEEK